ncbi:MAG: 1-deoxy-D-xylulose-5-phosphate reductoisomerase, partial [Gammaproteobacteria bacterium]|nr:1-deoxy-D-xylulose-5-phosphate reductoisomerase [Gammaproteobacteria bacterium]
FRVSGLAAARDWRALLEQARQFSVPRVALASASAAAELRAALGARPDIEVLEGAAGVVELARDAGTDTVMAAISGSAGLASTLAAAEAGKRVLLANKESVVMAGALLIAAVRRGGATLIPIDSEHNAIFQCLPATWRAGERVPGVERLLLTASGGPFLDWNAAQIAEATPEQACAHPRWTMGRKISVDSASLMNKGLELIEASVLFGMPPGDIGVLVHPQSMVHSLVEYADGSTLAQLAAPDMRTPIAQALAWPDRVRSGVESLDLVRVGRLDFLAPDATRFPCLRLAQAAARAGGLAPVWLNAADEVAVQAFLDRQLNFGDIPAVIEGVMAAGVGGQVTDLDSVLAADGEARRRTLEAVARLAGGRVRGARG